MKHARFFLNIFKCSPYLLPVLGSVMLILSGCVSAIRGESDMFVSVGTTDMLESVFTNDVRMQTERTFPIPTDEYDASILPNNYLSFIAYKGQAFIYFFTHHLSSFELYINNRKIPTQAICIGLPVCFDASPYIQDGNNLLYIAGLTPTSGAIDENRRKPLLQVKIPYPVIAPSHIPVKDPPYSEEAFKLLDELLTAETQQGFPGAQLVIIKNGKMVKSAAYGVISRLDNTGEPLKAYEPVTEKTLFDLASNTKMYAANFAVQKLISEKRLFLTDTVQKFFPQFIDDKKDKIKGKESITLFDLLTHQSGLPAGYHYTQKITKLKNAAEKSNREHTFDLIMTTPLVYQPRTTAVYSDVNYMLITYIIEKVTGMGLADYVTEHFYRPLGLDRVCFTPLQKGFTVHEIAATEMKKKSSSRTAAASIRSETLIHGTVHDGEAYFAMEQISGHAGLFANAESLAVLAQVMLNNGGYGLQRFFEPEVTGYFTAQQSLISSIGLGWRRQGMQDYTWAFSPLASANAFGHTGWTGTLTLIDPTEHLIIILLTNAKNTVPAHTTNNSKFEGDYYLVKRYGAIISLIYEAFRMPPQSQLDSMLIELAEKKYGMLQEITAFNNNGYIRDLSAIMQTLKHRAEKSSALQIFLKTDKAKAILKAIGEDDR